MAKHQTLFDSVPSAIEDIAAGKLVIVTDDESRENEGDLVMAASKATPQAINTMILHGRGLICVPTTAHQLKRLGIAQMVFENREAHNTDFSVSVDAAEGIGTGISAYDRTTTIRILADPEARPEMLVQPGHVFPLRARPGGVLERAGHTEAAVDLAALAGLHPSGVICEILSEDGSCARLSQLAEFKKKFGLKMISITDLITHRHKSEKLVEHIASEPFSCEYGKFDLHIFRNTLNKRQHIALSMGKLDEQPTLVRVQSQNLLSDVFQASKLYNHEALECALKKITAEKHGVLLYMSQPNAGIHYHPKRGKNKKAAVLSSSNMDFRDYGIGAQILAALGLKKIRLLSGRKRKVVALEGYDLEIVEQVPLS